MSDPRKEPMQPGSRAPLAHERRGGRWLLDALRVDDAGAVEGVAEVAGVVEPSHVGEVAALVSEARLYGLQVTWGGGLSNATGAASLRDDARGGPTLLVRSTRLDRVSGFDLSSRTVEAEGGARHAEVEGLAREHGATLGQGGAMPRDATLGGLVARRGGGRRASLAGKLDEALLGFELVTPGGEVVRQAAAPRFGCGLSAGAIVAGAEGQTGLIAKTTLAIEPTLGDARHGTRPRAFLFASLETALLAVRTLIDEGLMPSVTRVFDPMSTLLVASRLGLRKAGMGLLRGPAVVVGAAEGDAAGSADVRASPTQLATSIVETALATVTPTLRASATALSPLAREVAAVALREPSRLTRWVQPVIERAPTRTLVLLAFEGATSELAAAAQREAIERCVAAGAEDVGEVLDARWLDELAVHPDPAPTASGLVLEEIDVVAPWSCAGEVYRAVQAAAAQHALVVGCAPTAREDVEFSHGVYRG